MNDVELSNDAEESETTVVVVVVTVVTVVEGGVEELALTEAPETDRKVVTWVPASSSENGSGGRT